MKLEDIIRDSALPLVSAEGCGGDAVDAVPNNTFGHGRIDSLAAILSLATSIPGLSPGVLPLVVLPLMLLGWRRLGKTCRRLDPEGQ